MGLKDIINASKIREENDALKKLLTPEMQEAHALEELTKKLRIEESTLKESIDSAKKEFEETTKKREKDISNLDQAIANKKKQLILMDDEILVQEFGLYKPQYDFATALDYKEKLAEIRSKQKELIKNKKAVTGVTNWQVNGSTSKGKKLVSDIQLNDAPFLAGHSSTTFCGSL